MVRNRIYQFTWLMQLQIFSCLVCWWLGGIVMGQGGILAISEERNTLVLGPSDHYSAISNLSGQPLDDKILAEDRPPTAYTADGYGCQKRGYGWQVMPQGLVYRQYLAGVKESRFRGVWSNGKGEGNLLDVSLGGQVGLLRYGSYGDDRPVGWQLGIEGAGQVRLDVDFWLYLPK